MSARLIRLSTRRTGERKTVRVYVYDTRRELHEAAARFNGSFVPEADVAGVTQGYVIEGRLADGSWGVKADVTVVRVHRGRLTLEVLAHEMNHAAVGLYATSVPRDAQAGELLSTGNEVLAYLQSDLTSRLVDRLAELGYIQPMKEFTS